MQKNQLEEFVLSEKEDKPEKPSKEAISIGPRLLASGDFDRLYANGMGLIEEVAAYLDGEGRKESRELNREAAFVYASESMRLTTRLMQMASWLLLQRAIVEGEITSKSAQEEKQKIRFSHSKTNRSGPGWDELPPRLAEYIEKGDGLYKRVIRFDRLEKGDIAQSQAEAENSSEAIGGISEQFSRLKAAFSKND